MMLQSTGCRSTFGDQWLQITSARRFQAGPVSSRADDRNNELTVVPSGRGQLAQVLRYMKLNGREELQ